MNTIQFKTTNPLSRRVSKEIPMPSTFSLLSRQDSSIVTISNNYDKNPSYRVNSINLRSRSRSRSVQNKIKIKNIQIVNKKQQFSGKKDFNKKKKESSRVKFDMLI